MRYIIRKFSSGRGGVIFHEAVSWQDSCTQKSAMKLMNKRVFDGFPLMIWEPFRDENFMSCR